MPSAPALDDALAEAPLEADPLPPVVNDTGGITVTPGRTVCTIPGMPIAVLFGPGVADSSGTGVAVCELDVLLPPPEIVAPELPDSGEDDDPLLIEDVLELPRRPAADPLELAPTSAIAVGFPVLHEALSGTAKSPRDSNVSATSDGTTI
jgi:hypothetical protein